MILGEYEIKGRILLLPITGKGDINITMSKIAQKLLLLLLLYWLRGAPEHSELTEPMDKCAYGPVPVDSLYMTCLQNQIIIIIIIIRRCGGSKGCSTVAHTISYKTFQIITSNLRTVSTCVTGDRNKPLLAPVLRNKQTFLNVYHIKVVCCVVLLL
jgi:hypothetical protein